MGIAVINESWEVLDYFILEPGANPVDFMGKFYPGETFVVIPYEQI